MQNAYVLQLGGTPLLELQTPYHALSDRTFFAVDHSVESRCEGFEESGSLTSYLTPGTLPNFTHKIKRQE
ncbi:hypothetical protein J6590_092477 [Homalodisca vitripennis]|nr:hypothetical protein J6590_092477 [Homalodisca vitripennis]